MPSFEIVLIGLTLLCGFYVAWNIGANDVANAMGTSVGSGALTLRRAVLLAAVFEFAGAYIVGSNVSETVRKKMFDPAMLTEIYGEQAAYILACGMIAALMAAGTWLLIATWASWPVSTTHSIVGAVVGFGVIALGMEGIEWGKVGLISAGWVVSPLISGAIAYLLFGLLLKLVFFKRNPVRAAKRVTPYLVVLVILVLAGVTTYKGLKPYWKQQGLDPFSLEFVGILLIVSCGLGAVSFFIAKKLIARISPRETSTEPLNPVLAAEVSRSLAKALMHLKRVRNSSEGEVQVRAEELLTEVEGVQEHTRQLEVANADSDELRQVEKIFVILQVLTACLVAFAHGANDVANAIGPLSAAYQAIRQGVIEVKSTTPSWALLLGGTGIVIGLATWGWRVIQTVGKKITELTPSRGFCAEFAAAITILGASVLPIGLPVSTTHTLVGAVLGVGLARGINALNLKTMRDIIAGWAITIPAGAGLAIVFYLVLKAIFINSGWVDSVLP
ncbi:MAG: inorganic phosphate transporter [Mariniblastus sp.]|nr:inorganic phosphate transporter [Mariniblastus sp.]